MEQRDLLPKPFPAVFETVDDSGALADVCPERCPLQEDLAWLYPVGRCDIDYQAWTIRHTHSAPSNCRSCAMLSATRTCPPCLCSMCVMRQTISGTSVGRRVRAALSTLKE